MKRSGFTCLSLFLMLAAVLPAVAQVAPIGAPFEIASAEGTHTSPALLAARPDGSYLIVWTTQLPTGEVMYGRLLGPSGTPIGPQLLLGAGPISDPSVALSADGGFVMAWEQGGEILVSAFDRDGRVRIPAFAAAPKDPTLLPAKPDVAVGSDGGWMVAWVESQVPTDDFYQRISGRWFEPDGTPRTAPAPFDDPSYDELSRPELAALPDGGYLAVWGLEFIPNIEPIGDTSYFVTRRFDAAGAPVAPAKSLRWGGDDPRLFPLPGEGGFVLVEQARRGSPTIEDTQRLDVDGEGLPKSLTFGTPFSYNLSIAIDSAGRLLLVGTDRLFRRVSARLFDAESLAPLGAPFELATAKPPLGHPFLASASPGQFLMVWEDQNRWMGEVLVVGCGEPHLGLCLAQNRFRVEVSWRDHQGNTGTGHAVPLKDDTGSFWFFTPSNVELLVKVLDGRSLNGHFWVFYGSLSDVEYDIIVIDTQTDQIQTYHNAAGTQASHADVEAFPVDDIPPPPAAAATLPGRVRQTGAPLSPEIQCHSSGTALCLEPLYRVTIDFVDPQTGATRHAQAVPFSQESGAFWFFSPNNLELFVKVLDGSEVNGHAWVFYGGLTDVEYTLKVQDLAGAVWTYHNPRGRMSSGADPSALPPPLRF
jgi:hypothetical protein